MEDRFETDVAEVWSALTDPARLAVWYGDGRGRPPARRRVPRTPLCQRLGGHGRIEACETERRLLGLDQAR
jgi:uncharacterized protein YndB with AHSA1/START domain